MGLRVVLVLVLVLALSSPSVDGRRRQKRGDRKCTEEMMVQYRLTFHGYWAKSTFPKMYPRYRPKAQWSKLVGECPPSASPALPPLRTVSFSFSLCL